MRAAAYDRYGTDSVISVREVPDPVPRKGEVLVEVAYASLNPIDYKLRNGIARLIGRPRLPCVPGVDGSGTVVALGDGVDDFQVGQRVFGSPRSLAQYGTCAAKMAVPAKALVATPAEVTDLIAACLPTPAGTAYEALVSHAGVQSGQRVLVLGASGTVGSAAIQLATSLGVTSVGVCSTPNVPYVESLGASRVIDYKHENWMDDPSTYDLIFDAAAASSWSEAKPHLEKNGVFVDVMPRGPLFLRDAWGRLVGGRRPVAQVVKKDRALLEAVADLTVRGVFEPRIADTVELDEVESALRAIEAGGVHGKICVRLS